MFWLKSRRSLGGTLRDLDTTSPCAPWCRSPGCCVQPLTTPDPLRQERQDAGQHAATAHETHSPPDIIRRREPSVAKDRSLPHHATVHVGPTEPDTEGAGERGFGHAGVGAGGKVAVAKGGEERAKRPSRDGRDGERHNPRRHKVG